MDLQNQMTTFFRLVYDDVIQSSGFDLVILLNLKIL